MPPEQSQRAEIPTGGEPQRHRRRAFLPRWAGFWASAPLLVAALLSEGSYSLLRVLVFPLHASATRRRIAALVRGGAVMAVLGLPILGTSCKSFPGTSFAKQVDEFAWSTRVMLIGEPPAESLRMLADDTQSLLLGTSWSEVAWDIEQIFYDPDWYGSLADDTRELVSWEAREFTETFQMLGW